MRESSILGESISSSGVEHCKQLHKKKAPRYIALHPSLAPLTRLICMVEK
jgi:hypothetical protein